MYSKIIDIPDENTDSINPNLEGVLSYNTPMFQSISELCRFLHLDPAQLPVDLSPSFPLKVPQHFANQMQKYNPEDPLLRQVLPILADQQTVHFQFDPVGDLNKNPMPALLQKYQTRALLLTSPRCDIHCRYCFRQHFPYEQVQKKHWQHALAHLTEETTIKELILSGGDPFSLSEPALLALLSDIERNPHLRTLRIHSRTPVVAPDRAPSEAFLKWSKHTSLKVILVVHSNHAQELSEETAALFEQYRQAGIVLLNQSVLLKGVNDSTQALSDLSWALIEQGVVPYYCHLLDPVKGAESFYLEDDQAWQIFESLRKEMPGYLVPRLVREIPGEPYKTLIH